MLTFPNSIHLLMSLNRNTHFLKVHFSTFQESMQNVSILKKAFTTPSTRRAIVLGCLLQLFQQVAGINTVMYYSAKIISLAGISDDTTAIWISAGVASVNFLCTFIGLFLVERIGRRKLLLGSMLGKSGNSRNFLWPRIFFFFW